MLVRLRCPEVKINGRECERNPAFAVYLLVKITFTVLGLLCVGCVVWAASAEPGLATADESGTPVTFVSNGGTMVQILNIKMLGPVLRTTVKLKPGTYEIVGRRRGYVDARTTIQVKNDDEPKIVEVACIEVNPRQKR